MGPIVWLTGLPASGKSTVARGLVSRLERRGRSTVWLDSDELRAFLTPAPTYSETERDWFYAAMGELALIAARGGAVVVVSATAPKRLYRDRVRARASRFVEVLVQADLETLQRRDPKGLYLRAGRGEIGTLPGAGAAYQPPLTPELVLDTTRAPPEALVEALEDSLVRE